MSGFSRNSKEELYKCDTRLIQVCEEVIKYIDFIVLCGRRGKEAQDKAYREGRSRLKYPQSKHNTNPSLAVDIAPYPIDWDDTNRFTYLAGHMRAVAKMMGVEICWGGNWQRDNDLQNNKWNDLVHFELIIG